MTSGKMKSNKQINEFIYSCINRNGLQCLASLCIFFVIHTWVYHLVTTSTKSSLMSVLITIKGTMTMSKKHFKMLEYKLIFLSKN